MTFLSMSCKQIKEPGDKSRGSDPAYFTVYSFTSKVRMLGKMTESVRLLTGPLVVFQDIN